jgi:DNA-binding NarL/FixJ family response regulator
MPFEDSVRVLVVDDHAGIRTGVARLVDGERPRMASVGAAATIEEALAHTVQRQPHVVVLDVNLDGDDGLALIPALRLAAPCAIVVLTSLTDRHIAARALRLGAHSCLQKTAPASQLLACVLAAGCSVAAGASSHPPIEGGVVSHANGTKRPGTQGSSADGAAADDS